MNDGAMAFVQRFGDLVAEVSASRGSPIEPPELSPALLPELLEFAGVVAHQNERRYAPLASYLVGRAVERQRGSTGAAEAETISGFLAELRRRLTEDAARRD